MSFCPCCDQHRRDKRVHQWSYTRSWTQWNRQGPQKCRKWPTNDAVTAEILDVKINDNEIVAKIQIVYLWLPWSMDYVGVWARLWHPGWSRVGECLVTNKCHWQWPMSMERICERNWKCIGREIRWIRRRQIRRHFYARIDPFWRPRKKLWSWVKLGKNR